MTAEAKGGFVTTSLNHTLKQSGGHFVILKNVRNTERVNRPALSSSLQNRLICPVLCVQPHLGAYLCLQNGTNRLLALSTQG